MPYWGQQLKKKQQATTCVSQISANMWQITNEKLFLN